MSESEPKRFGISLERTVFDRIENLKNLYGESFQEVFDVAMLEVVEMMEGAFAEGAGVDEVNPALQPHKFTDTNWRGGQEGTLIVPNSILNLQEN